MYARLSARYIQGMNTKPNVELAKTARTQELKVDDIVKFALPEGSLEADERFQVLEDREDRVLVGDLRWPSWGIRPTFVYLKADLVKCGEIK